jgi:hypothetical protein
MSVLTLIALLIGRETRDISWDDVDAEIPEALP